MSDVETLESVMKHKENGSDSESSLITIIFVLSVPLNHMRSSLQIVKRLFSLATQRLLVSPKGM